MSNFSYKYKIYTVIGGVMVLTLIFFLFVYGSMNSHNDTLAIAVAAKNQEYQEVLAEQQSYELGKKDLESLKSKPFQPSDLFSQDTKVVKEVKTLESIAQGLGVEFTMQVSGTIKTAPKLTQASAQIFIVPYVMILEGSFDKVTNFIQSAEHLNFVTHTKAIDFSVVESGKLQAKLTSEFYIQP